MFPFRVWTIDFQLLFIITSIDNEKKLDEQMNGRTLHREQVDRSSTNVNTLTDWDETQHLFINSY